MSRRLKLVSILALGHLVVVVLGASNIRLHREGALGELVTWYGALTGAERGFGFFAPSVNTQARVVFTIENADGNLSVEEMGAHLGQEARLRLNNLASQFWQFIDNPNHDLRRSVAASWTSEVFRRYPSAHSVRIQLQLFELPSMTAYRQGQREHWKTLYYAKFKKKDPRVAKGL